MLKYFLCALLLLGPLFSLTAKASTSDILSNNSQQTVEEDVITVRFPRVDDSEMFQEQGDYYYELLQLALANADKKFDIEVVPIPIMPKSRSMRNIQNGQYDVHWASSSIEREAILRPVRIPVLKGLLGLRIALVNQDSLNGSNDIQQFEQLKDYSFGQGFDWIDTKILKDYGLTILQPSNNTSMYDLLKRQRIDFFPRSLIEVWFEKEHVNDERIQVDDKFALYYILPTYFFVRESDELLHEQLSIGLNRSIEDGSFDLLFNRYFETYIEQAKLDQRKIFVLENNYLSEQTPLDRKELWLRPFTLPIKQQTDN